MAEAHQRRAMNDCLRMRVHGRVQGVSFRAHTRQIAITHQLSGWAQNCADGSVDIVLVGPAPEIAAAKALIIAGPALARVDRVEYLDAPELPQPPANDFVTC